MEETIGSIAVSDQILCSCVANSTKKYPGVVALDKDSAENALDILSRDVSAAEGVRLTRKDGIPVIDVHVIIELGTQIPKLAWELQKIIRSDLKSITGQDIDDINIHIEGVNYKE